MADEKSTSSSPSNASCSKDEEPSGNWWDSWISSAKSKSAEVYSMVKKDLDEIGSAVKCEANLMLSTTSEAIGKTFKLDEPESPANVMKKSISSFIGQMSTALSPEPDDEDTEVILSTGDTALYSTYKLELEALQRLDATFIVAPDTESFAAWRAAGGGARGARGSARQHASPLLRAQRDRLVPDAVGEDDFWERYLFRVALLQDRLANAARSARAAQGPAAAAEGPAVQGPAAQGPAAHETDPVLAHLPMQTALIIDQSPKKVMPDLEPEPPAERPADWQDFAVDLDLSEEQQTLLLEEYEKEIATKKQGKTGNNNKNKSGKRARDNMNNRSIDKTNGKQDGGPRRSDACGNELVEDHFAETPKDDVSSNSDESWEKDFEIDNAQKA